MNPDASWIAPAIAFGQVVLIDVTLAGDNAVVVGLAVSGLPARLKARAILIGIGLATLIRVALSLVAVQLLAVVGLTLAGGLLLLWVCWKMFRELRHGGGADPADPGGKTLRQAVLQIAVADLSMSLDNVLAVAGAAHAHIWVMVAGLGLSVVLMAVAANVLARLLERQRWIAWVGLAVVVYVAGKMIWDGWHQVAPQVAPALPGALAYGAGLALDASAAARSHPWLLFAALGGLELAVCAGLARLTGWRWIAWVGVAIVVLAGVTLHS